MYMWYSFFGKTIVYLKNRTADVILAACKEHKVTHIYAVPLLWNNVAKSLLRKARLQGEKTYDKLISFCDLSIRLQRRFGSLGKSIASKVFSGTCSKSSSAAASSFDQRRWTHSAEALKVVNGIGYHLVSGFGMTETGIDSVELSDDIDRKLDASVGRPFAPMEYRIVREKPDDATGELQIRGEAIHSGRMVDGVYIAREEGWLASGDIAREVNGRYYIEGRLKDVIVGESGENVYPDELEDSFAELPHAEHICVAGIAAADIYDETTLIVSMGDDANDRQKTGELIAEIARINGLLPIYKKIKKAYLSLEPLPLANGIKVRRQKVKEAIERGQGRFEEIDIRGGVIRPHEQPEAAADRAYNGTELSAIVEKVRGIFAEVLDMDPAAIRDTDHFVDDLGGDSLSSLGVFSKAEEAYGVIIPDTDYFTCANVQDLARLLYRKLHDIEAEAPAEKTREVHRISRFSQSREYAQFAQRMLSLKDAGIRDPYFVPHDSVLRDTSVVDGREIINLASYNYVGMSGHPRTAAAAKKGHRRIRHVRVRIAPDRGRKDAVPAAGARHRAVEAHGRCGGAGRRAFDERHVCRQLCQRERSGALRRAVPQLHRAGLPAFKERHQGVPAQRFCGAGAYAGRRARQIREDPDRCGGRVLDGRRHRANARFRGAQKEIRRVSDGRRGAFQLRDRQKRRRRRRLL